MTSNQSFFKFILRFLKPYKWHYFIVILCMTYNGLQVSLEPYLIKIIVDQVATYNESYGSLFSHVLPYVLLFIGACAVHELSWQFKNGVEAKMIPEIENNASLEVYNYLQYHSHSYFQEKMAGTLSTKISDLHTSVDRIISISAQFFRLMVGILITILLMWTVHFIFATILTVWFVIALIISCFASKWLEKFAILRARKRSAVFGNIVDSLSNIMAVRLFARQNYELRDKAHAFKLYRQYDQDFRYRQIYAWLILGVFSTILLTLMLIGLVFLAQRKMVVVGDFTFIMMTSISIINNIFFMIDLMTDFVEYWGNGKQGADIMDEPHEILDMTNAPDILVTEGRIEFNNVVFGYGARPLLKNISIVIESGERVGLVGYSGSGKTTCANLILRLYDLKSGEILIDGQDISKVTQKSLRDSISYIAQEPILFHRTIYENIRYGKLEATEGEIIHAAEMAHAHEFIMKTREKYDTQVGERGISLSGGQRQRIAIARAYLKDAPILIMDEATSALDSKTEQLIQDSVRKLMKSKTVIVIAHRLSTLLDMDRILVFEQGQIIEDGHHTELLKMGGLYSKLWNTQINGFVGPSPMAVNV